MCVCVHTKKERKKEKKMCRHNKIILFFKLDVTRGNKNPAS